MFFKEYWTAFCVANTTGYFSWEVGLSPTTLVASEHVFVLKEAWSHIGFSGGKRKVFVKVICGPLQQKKKDERHTHTALSAEVWRFQDKS